MKQNIRRLFLFAALAAVLALCACGDAGVIGPDDGPTYAVASAYEPYAGEDYYADYVEDVIEIKEGTAEPVAATVTFAAPDGASGTLPEAIGAMTGETVTVPACALSLEESDFAGWSDGVRYVYPGEDYAVTGDVTLTARFLSRGTSYLMHACDDSAGWWSDSAVEATDGQNEGDKALKNNSSKCIIFCYAFSGLEMSAFHDNGTLELDVWVEKADTLVTGGGQGRIELSHDGGAHCTWWDIGTKDWVDGWNHFSLPVAEAGYDSADFSAISYFRLFQHVNTNVTMKIDNMIMTGSGDIHGIRYESGMVADEAVVLPETAIVAEGARVILPESLFNRDGYAFAGWSDGESVIPAGERYFMPAHSVIMTAVWEPVPVYTVSFSTDGGHGQIAPIPVAAGSWLTLPEKAPVKAGYVFAGWTTDGSDRYTPSERLVMPAQDLALVPVWQGIPTGDFAEGLVESWPLSDGGVSGRVLSDAIGGTEAVNHWGTWLNSATFGRTIDFSTYGSNVRANATAIDFSGDFAVGAWIKAPVREDQDRTVFMVGTRPENAEYEDITLFDDVSRQLGWFCDGFESGTPSYVYSTYKDDSGAHIMYRELGRKPVDASDYTDGLFHFRFYIEDASSVSDGQIELTSSGGCDVNEIHWNIKSGTFADGWNDLYLPIATAESQGGDVDLSRLNYFRIYFFGEDTVKFGVDDMWFCHQHRLTEQDGAMLYLDADNDFALTFAAPGLEGVKPAKTDLVDGKWHYVAVSRAGDKLSYYADGKTVGECTVSGAVYDNLGSDLVIGSTLDDLNGFDGSIAELHFYNCAKTPDTMTLTVIDEDDNTPHATRLKLEKGLVYDRRQYYAPRPYDYEGQTVTEDDIINAKNMGFDHVKLLLTPNHLVAGDGSLIVENMEYITEVVNYAVDHDLTCYICLHPESDFKPIYLGNLSNFEILCKWYGELAAYIGANWSADDVGLQLMTEPNSQDTSVDWSWYSDRMWSAVRNVLPDHTILTSSDSSGNIERIKLMSPATDDNLIYTFTTYEPYTIGWYWYGSYSSAEDYFWKYVRDIPYPVEKGVDYSDAIEHSIELVPDAKKDIARKRLTEYVTGDCDWWMDNYYPDYLYNRDWHFARAKSLHEWSEKYGGNIHLMAVEWGCMDNITPNRLWNNGLPEGCGCPDETRYTFVRDMRESFEEYGIGWSYWSYSEAHTVFLPETHYYGESPDPETAIETKFDWYMLKDCLGLTPLVEQPAE